MRRAHSAHQGLELFTRSASWSAVSFAVTQLEEEDLRSKECQRGLFGAQWHDVLHEIPCTGCMRSYSALHESVNSCSSCNLSFLKL